MYPLLVENMTDEIYSAVESNTEIGINITLKNQVKATQTRENNTTQMAQRDGRTVANMPEKKEVADAQNKQQNTQSQTIQRGGDAVFAVKRARHT